MAERFDGGAPHLKDLFVSSKDLIPMICRRAHMKNPLLALLFCMSLCRIDSFAKAFPQAEGFGAQASGGRGGEVNYVTSLNGDGRGSLKHALVNTSGIAHIEGWHRSYGQFTFAGHSSPGGVIIRGFVPNTNIDKPQTFFAN